jgi:hypothetical protein
MDAQRGDVFTALYQLNEAGNTAHRGRTGDRAPTAALEAWATRLADRHAVSSATPLLETQR